eukprot:194823-Alexandrium_andersonii.AAC.1
MEAMPMPSAAPFAMPASSASPELSAIILRGGPMLYGMHSTHADAAARGPPRAKSPSKVSVNKRADRGSLILLRGNDKPRWAARP